jgi:hypothetical protein
MVLGELFNIDSFTSSFVYDTLDQDVHHVNVLLRLKDVQVIFGFLFLVLHLKTFLFVPFLGPTNLLALTCLFYATFKQVFGRLLLTTIVATLLL